MNPVFEKIYHLMLTDIDQCKSKNDTCAEIECCFQICRNSFTDLEQETESHHFKSACEAIEFYKELRPKFIALIQYYNLLYQAHILQPFDRSLLKEFWLREGSRLDKFILDNKPNYDYYRSGSTLRDEELFLNAATESKGDKKMFYDEWIGNLLALERYQDFVTRQLASL